MTLDEEGGGAGAVEREINHHVIFRLVQRTSTSLLFAT